MSFRRRFATREMLLFITNLRLFVCVPRIGQVYRALNLQGDNESVSSVSSDGFADQPSFISSTSQQPQQQQQQQQYQQPQPNATSASHSHQIPSSSSSLPSDNNLASRRDDDGNVEFDFD